jgi:molybdate transport system substrate-binding protein
MGRRHALSVSWQRAPYVAVPLAFMVACGGDAPRGAGIGEPNEPMLVLAASDLQDALAEIAEAFEQEAGDRVQVVFGSTGNLAAQIQSGAPADLFFAANERFLDQLIVQGLILEGTRSVYGTGKIALVGRPGGRLPRSLDELTGPEYGTVAIANPEHAPYGTAAREALEATGTWDALSTRLVYAENIAQTLQLVRTGNADAGIVALGLLLGPNGMEHERIDPALHAPLRQAAAVIGSTRRPERARAFLAYVMGDRGQTVLGRYGFGPTNPP